MPVRSIARPIGILILLVSFAYPSIAIAHDATPGASPVAGGLEVVASGLTNPRGFTWGDDGTLYLVLAGTGGDTQLEVQATPLPFMVGDSGSLATIVSGCPTPMAEGIPSLYWADAGWTWGPMDVVTIAGELYVLAGGGHTADAPNGIYRVLDDGSLELVADLATWASENPPAFIAPDYNVEGSWFDLETDGEKLWVSEAVGGRLLTVTREGEITLVADLSEGHLVPTGVALDGEGGAYVGFETTVPYPDGSSKVVHVAADGTVSDQWTGLTAVTDLVLGPDGVLYAAEMATNNLDAEPYLNPGSGRIVRQTGPDSMEDVVTDIDYPAYLGFDTEGSLYFTAPAFGENRGEGLGMLVRVDMSTIPVSMSGAMSDEQPTCASS